MVMGYQGMGPRFRRQAVFAILVLAVVSCSPRKDSLAERDPLERAYRKLDAGHVDQAVSDLEELRTRDQRPEVLEALASAHALKAGLRVEDYWGFLVGFRAPLLELDKIEASSTMTRWRDLNGRVAGQVQWPDSKGLVVWAEMLAGVELWRERIEHLPALTDEGEQHVLKAIAVLENHPKPGARLYRALLALIVVKHRVLLGLDGWSRVEERLRAFAEDPKAEEVPGLMCALNLGSFQTWAQELLAFVQLASSDLMAAFPSQQKDYRGAFEASSQLIEVVRAQSLPEDCP